MVLNDKITEEIECKNSVIDGYCKYENKGCLFNDSNSNKISKEMNLDDNNNNNSEDKIVSNIEKDMKDSFSVNQEEKRTKEENDITSNCICEHYNKFTDKTEGVNVLENIFTDDKFKRDEIENNQKEKKNNSLTNKSNAKILFKKFDATIPSFKPSNFDYKSYFSQGSGGNPIVEKLNSLTQYNRFVGNGSVFLLKSGSSMSSDPYCTHSKTLNNLYHQSFLPLPPPRITPDLLPDQINTFDMFISNDLRNSLLKKNEATLQSFSHSNLPECVNIYHTLVPIDKNYKEISAVWNLKADIYKVFSTFDGNAYTLRVINHNFEITDESPFKSINKWKSISNANIVQLHDGFTNCSFGDCCIILVYDYYPNSETLLSFYKKNKNTTSTKNSVKDVIWSFLIQLTNALITIHSKNLAARSSINLSKIIVTNENRIRFSACGVSEILNYVEDKTKIRETGFKNYIKILQSDDIKNLGKIMVQLTKLMTSSNLKESYSDTDIFTLKNSYSDFIGSSFFDALFALTNPSPDLTLQIFAQEHLTSNIFTTIDSFQNSCDFMENQLMTELENGRLFRLMTKLSFVITKSPEEVDNKNFHLVKLFYHHVFSQIDENEKPILDLSNVLSHLNKLDAGIDEKIMLISKDKNSCVIVIYKELKDIIESIYLSLTRY